MSSILVRSQVLSKISLSLFKVCLSLFQAIVSVILYTYTMSLHSDVKLGTGKLSTKPGNMLWVRAVGLPVMA